MLKKGYIMAKNKNKEFKTLMNKIRDMKEFHNYWQIEFYSHNQMWLIVMMRIRSVSD